jgi:hypothetical protein
MGVKSTVELTRELAEEKLLDMIIARKRKIMSQNSDSLFPHLSNQEIEDALEKLNDEAYGGEGFANYLIVDQEQYDVYQSRWD